MNTKLDLIVLPWSSMPLRGWNQVTNNSHEQSGWEELTMAVELRYQAFLIQLDIEEGGDRQTTTGEPLAKRDSRHQTHRRVGHFIRGEVVHMVHILNHHNHGWNSFHMRIVAKGLCYLQNIQRLIWDGRWWLIYASISHVHQIPSLKVGPGVGQGGRPPRALEGMGPLNMY